MFSRLRLPVAALVLTMLVGTQLPTFSAIVAPKIDAQAATPSLSVTMSDPVGTPQPDGILRYNVRFTNSTSVVARNVRFGGQDPVNPAAGYKISESLIHAATGFPNCTFATAPGAAGYRILSCGPLEKIDPGQSYEFIIQMNTKATTPCGEVISLALDVIADGFAGTWSRIVQTPISCGATATDVSVTKTGPATIIRPSQDGQTATIVYTITAHNSGTTEAQNVVVSDPIPSGLTLNAAGTTAGYALVNGVLSWTLGSIAAGQSKSVTVSFSVPYLAACTQTVVVQNTATVTASNDSTPNNNSSQTVSTSLQCPTPTTADLSVTKTTSQTTVTRGGTLSYAITASNAGPARATGVVVRDLVPAGLTYNPGASDAACSLVGTEVKCMNFDLEAGQNRTFTVSFTVPTVQEACVQTTVQNTASIFFGAAGGVTDPNANNNQSQTVTTTVLCNSQTAITVVKSDGRTSVQPGETLTYTITLTNSSTSSAAGFTVSDVLPASVTFVSASDGGYLSGQTVFWSNLSLAAAATRTLTLQARVNDNAVSGTVISNTATVSVGVTGTGTDTTTVTTTTQNQLTFAKTDNRTTVQAGETLSYQLTITNNSATAASNVIVNDLVPQNLTFISASDGGYLNGQTVTWIGLSVPAFGSKTLTMQARVSTGVSNGTVITNTASISGTNITATDTTSIQSSSTGTIRIETSDSPDPVRPCGTLTYTIRLTNDSSFQQTVTATQILPRDADYESSSDGGSHSNGTVTWTNLTVNANSTRVLTVTVEVDCDADDGDTLRTTVYVGSITDDESTRVRDDDDDDREQCRDGLDNDNDGAIDYPNDSGCSSSTDDTEIGGTTGSALVTVQKYADRTEAHPGEQLSYTVTVRNVSGVTAQTLTVEDTFPSTLTITDPGTGIAYGSSLRWQIASLSPNEVRTFTYRATLSSTLTQGFVVQNTVRVTGSNLGTPGNAAATVQIVQVLPTTGLSDFTGPLENTRRFLSPIGGKSSAIPAILWSSVALMGIAAGARVGRRYFL